MQDLARAAGMSVGNFYRYFPSKSAIVEGLVARDMAEMEAQFSAILGAPDPMAALRRAIVARILDDDCHAEGQIWAEITAAANRKPEIGEISRRMEAGIVERLTTVFAHVSGLAPEEAQARWSGHARFVVMLVKASGMHRIGSSGEPTLRALVLAAVENTLNDISSHRAKG
jgi:AcrR family transcriptional regulator